MTYSLFELIAVTCIMISVWEATEKSISTWWFGMIGVISYMFVFWSQQLYISFGLQFIFIIQNFYGILKWKNGFNKIQYNFNPILLMGFSVLFLITIFFIFDKFSNNPQPFLDSVVTTLSILATYLLINGKRESWLIWMIVDVFYIVLFYNQNLFLSSALYVLLLFLSLTGYWKWKNTK